MIWILGIIMMTVLAFISMVSGYALGMAAGFTAMNGANMWLTIIIIAILIMFWKCVKTSLDIMRLANSTRVNY